MKRFIIPVYLMSSVVFSHEALLADAPKIAKLPDASQNLTRIAFGSCADEEIAQPIWKQIAADNPELFLFIGDNVYADKNRGEWVNDFSRAELEYSYRTLQQHPEFTDFQSKFPMLVTWDDHDFGKNDAGIEFDLKTDAKELMLETFGLPQDSSIADRDGVYHSAYFGEDGKRIQIIMLDTRWYRSALTVTDERGAKGKERYLPSQDPDQDMLGDAQWKWLAEELEKPADLRLLVSSIQVLADGHGWEAWRTMPKERERLYKLLQDTGASNTVILSGDRHVGGFYQKSDVFKSKLTEITSSSLNLSFNSGKVDETGPNQLGDLYGPENYGLILVDWNTGQVSLNLKNNTGQVVQNVSISIK
ncbi:alkaline phosphatase D family protein [Kordiimonas sp. SCSIO 12610]|uniref:alkaline phosphatase D family protein n=1 Tax=Kordiimonas sp. SCSIO 12610 TaxID=2829597 RepID=UPI002108EE31|nr:alkaline phosphatase D family protein [Kordiimonas sp. SCSIO 12610]UTW54831.1 alkaline phosphatase family protein [Kordiimonas sp. SCSIO 12610]